MIFGSGISDREESLNALLNFCLLKGLPGQGAIIPTALQANARGAVSILGAATSPEDVLFSPDIAGIVIYEEDPFQYLNGEKVKDALAKKAFVLVCDILPTARDGFRPSDDSLHHLCGKGGHDDRRRRDAPGGEEGVRRRTGRAGFPAGTPEPTGGKTLHHPR